MSIVFFIIIVIYCAYLHRRIYALSQEFNRRTLDLLDDVLRNTSKINELKRNEKPRRKPAKIRSRLPKTTISKD